MPRLRCCRKRIYEPVMSLERVKIANGQDAQTAIAGLCSCWRWLPEFDINGATQDGVVPQIENFGHLFSHDDQPVAQAAQGRKAYPGKKPEADKCFVKMPGDRHPQ